MIGFGSHFTTSRRFPRKKPARLWEMQQSPTGRTHYTREGDVRESGPGNREVLDRKELKDIRRTGSDASMDSPFLNYEVAELKGQIPTMREDRAGHLGLRTEDYAREGCIACGL